jgi:hypothetical protein
VVPPKLAILSFTERLARFLLTIISNLANAGKASQTNGPEGRSPEQLKRELRSDSTRCGSQSMPASPCWLSLTYFPLSKHLIL